MSKILVVDDDPLLLGRLRDGLAQDGHHVLESAGPCGAVALLHDCSFDLLITDHHPPSLDGLQLIREARRIQQQHGQLRCILITKHGSPEVVLGALREQVSDFLVKPFRFADLQSAVTNLLALGGVPSIEVLSASHEWVRLRVPCSLAVVPILQKLLAELRTDFPSRTRDAIGYAFREMINNAIEYGGQSDPSRFVQVTCIRLHGAIIFCIADPGAGFNAENLQHAAVSNPDDDLLCHASVRARKGLRPGGFGILLTKHLVDELVYNEQRNEVLFVKYLRDGH